MHNKHDVETKAKARHVNIRDSLFGGRTEAFKSYAKCTGNQQICYFDVTSLYPTVNALDDYAVGFKKYVEITADDILSGKFFGVAKVDITPPKDLYVPVLPDNSNKKLMFHLDPLIEKTFSSGELKRALEKGYVIDKIHPAVAYTKKNGLMRDYVGTFIKMKLKTLVNDLRKNVINKMNIIKD